jgi:hypothetical protein
LASSGGGYEHAPALHDWLAALQSVQQALWDPQFVLDVPG